MKNMPLLEDGAELSLEALQAHFQAHDFSTAVSRYDSEKASNAERQLYSRIRNHFEKAWIEQMGQISKQNNLRNFSKKAPVRCLEEAEEKLVAGTVMEILADEQLCASIMDATLTSMEQHILDELERYAQEQGKDADDLTDEELAAAVDRFSDRFLGKMMNLLEQVQQVPAILKIGKSMPAHEDFNENAWNNYDKIDFVRKWNHLRTQTGALLELDEEMERTAQDSRAQIPISAINNGLSAAFTREEFSQHLLNIFIQSVEDSTDREILYLTADGMTQQEIARRLGFKNHSAVSKRLAKLHKRFDAFLAEFN